MEHFQFSSGAINRLPIGNCRSAWRDEWQSSPWKFMIPSKIIGTACHVWQAIERALVRGFFPTERDWDTWLSIFFLFLSCPPSALVKCHPSINEWLTTNADGAGHTDDYHRSCKLVFNSERKVLLSEFTRRLHFILLLLNIRSNATRRNNKHRPTIRWVD